MQQRTDPALAMFKDILVAPTGLAGDAMAVEAGIALGACFQAHVAVAETMYLPAAMSSAWGVQPDEGIMQQLRSEQRAAAERRATAWRERLERESVPCEIRIVEAPRSDSGHLVMHARHADLVVVPRGERGFEFAFVERFFGLLLFDSGRPVLLAPAELKLVVPVRHVVVAWQGGKEATRALHDALPLLQLAETVDVLEIVRAGSTASDEGAAYIDIASHLARHGVNVCVVRHHENATGVSTALLRHCEESAAGLLVAGGYGHSRMREWIFGGTTRELVRSALIPVLFSH